MIKVYVGTAERFAAVEPVMEGCLRDHTDSPVDITFLRAGEHGLRPSGCTGFTMYRYAIPHLMGRQGRAIYLDVDMFVLADIAELWEYGYNGAWSCLKDGSTEVMVIDSSCGATPPARKVHQYRKGSIPINYRRCIPLEWNSEDELTADTKLLHFTNLALQPWQNDEHPLFDFWKELEAEYGDA